MRFLTESQCDNKLSARWLLVTSNTPKTFLECSTQAV